MKILKSLFIGLMFTSLSYGHFEIKVDPQIKFTGYKFSDKVGVSGTFKSVSWKSTHSEKLEELIKSVSFKADSYTVDAGNRARNKNITSALFKNWGGQYIVGKVISVDSKKKSAKVELKIGDSANTVDFKYEKSKKDLLFKGSIDLIKLGFLKSFNLLSKQCALYHVGSDGVTKTWSVVDLELMVKLK